MMTGCRAEKYDATGVSRLSLGVRALRAACISLLVLCGVSGCLSQRGRYVDFTSAELAQFIEAPKLLPMWKVDVFAPGDFAWYDDRRLVVTLGDKSGVPKIALVDVYSGQIELTPYRGNLGCYADGNIAVYGQGRTADYGRLGAKLENKSDSFVQKMVTASCLEPWYETKEGVRVVNEADPKAFYKISPLRQGDGVLRQRLSELPPGYPSFVFLEDQMRRNRPEKFVPLHESELIDAHGRVHVLRTRPLLVDIGYDLFQKKYFGRGLGIVLSDYFTSSGEVSMMHVRPPLMAREDHAQDYAVARNGVFYPSRMRLSSWRQQGVFYSVSGQLYRIDDAWPNVTAGISPNGCLFAYNRFKGNPWLSYYTLSNLELMIVDTCKGSSQ